jgi:hypothetical protein
MRRMSIGIRAPSNLEMKVARGNAYPHGTDGPDARESHRISISEALLSGKLSKPYANLG